MRRFSLALQLPSGRASFGISTGSSPPAAAPGQEEYHDRPPSTWNRSRPHESLRLALAVLLVAPAQAAAQTTWIVDAANGPGANFTTIPAAVRAASAGDTILVRPASAGYAGATISKGIYLLGEGQAGLTSELRITGVPLSQAVAIKNFRMLASTV